MGSQEISHGLDSQSLSGQSLVAVIEGPEDHKSSALIGSEMFLDVRRESVMEGNVISSGGDCVKSFKDVFIVGGSDEENSDFLLLERLPYSKIF